MLICPLDLNLNQKVKKMAESSLLPQIPENIFQDMINKAQSGELPLVDSSSELARQISMSTPYMNAWKIFSSDPLYGPPFLERLKMIPSSVQEADPTWIDQIGLSNNAVDINRGAYNKAMSEIQNLVNSYYEFINTLPSSQNSQFRDIGLNSAITGQGLQGSSMAMAPSDSSSLNQLRSADPMNVVSLVGSLIGTTASAVSGSIGGITSGIMSIYKNVNDIAIARDNLEVAQYNAETSRRSQKASEAGIISNVLDSLVDSGYDLREIDFSTVQGVTDFFGKVRNDPKMLEIANNTLASAGKSYVTAQPWKSVAYLSDTDYNPALDAVYKANRKSPSQTFDEFFASMASYEADMMFLETMRDRAAAKFDSDVATKLSEMEGASDAASDAAVAGYYRDEAVATYDELMNATRYDYLSGWLDQYKETKDPAEKFMILQTVWGLGLNEMIDYDLIDKTGSPILGNVVRKAPKAVLDAAGWFIPAGKLGKSAKAIGRMTKTMTSGPKGETVTE